MKKILAKRQGDVIIEHNIVKKLPKGAVKLNHLVLAEGEITGHKHQVIEGEANLYEKNGKLFLEVLSDKVVIGHNEHKQVIEKRGIFPINFPQEYDYVEEENKKISD